MLRGKDEGKKRVVLRLEGESPVVADFLEPREHGAGIARVLERCGRVDLHVDLRSGGSVGKLTSRDRSSGASDRPGPGTRRRIPQKSCFSWGSS